MNDDVNPEDTGSDQSVPAQDVQVEYCGEWFQVSRDQPFTIGRSGDLVVDDNTFLHRRLIQISFENGIWLLTNVGSRLSVTITDGVGRLQSWLAPGARLPIVFERTSVVFTAGSTSYELFIHSTAPTFEETHAQNLGGETTVGNVTLTPTQKLAILALAENLLEREGSGLGAIPTNAAAAERLRWSATRFNRKLDNVCDKLDRIGVRGLRGGPRSYATNRRARLVEYAIGAQLVTRADLPLLDMDIEDDA